MTEFNIRTMTLDEVDMAVEWAAQEGGIRVLTMLIIITKQTQMDFWWVSLTVNQSVVSLL